MASITTDNFLGRWDLKTCKPPHNKRCNQRAIILRNYTLFIGQRLSKKEVVNKSILLFVFDWHSVKSGSHLLLYTSPWNCTIYVIFNNGFFAQCFLLLIIASTRLGLSFWPFSGSAPVFRPVNMMLQLVCQKSLHVWSDVLKFCHTNWSIKQTRRKNLPTAKAETCRSSN